MFTQHQLENILFLDIETVSLTATYAQLPERMQKLWDKKSERYKKGDPDKNPSELYEAKAAIHAEFGKVVCISCGYLKFDLGGKAQIRTKSFCNEDESNVLRSFGEMLDKWSEKKGRNLCAHNGKEFDFPYLGRRFVVNGLPLPQALQVQGKKPWEVNFIDTMDLWKFGDYKAYTSLDLLSAILDIPTPKDDIDGSQVGKVFWEESDLERIQTYCEKDVMTTAQVLLRMSRLPLIEDPT